tara:strand:+ start:310 stop:978 length:669 start_codon:yes stop_codon:yes gene_type:complete
MTLLALIPARGGSKRVPRKNINSFCGKPLIQWTIELAQSIDEIDKVIVSTEDQEIASLAIKLGAEVPFIRPKHLARDETPGIEPVLHALEELPDIDEVLLLQATSPLRNREDILNLLDMRNKYKAESIVSINPTKSAKWMYTITPNSTVTPIIDNNFFDKSTNNNKVYCLNGALFYGKRDFLLEKKSFISDKTIGYVMPDSRSIDIDTCYDWKIAEYLKNVE